MQRNKTNFAFLILALLAPLASAQNSRWDYVATTTQGSGQQLPVYALPFATISFFSCTAGDCSTLANTYNSFNSTSACPTGSQVVLQQTAACSNQADAQGNFGAWFLPGQYAFTIAPQYGGLYGPLNFTVGSTGGGGTSTCGPLAGDATSTNCGNGNFTGLAGSSSLNQAYGYFNIDSSSGIDEIVAVGFNNAQSTTNFNDLVAIGLSNGANLNSGNSVVAIGQSTGNGRTVGTVNPISTFDVVAIGDGAAGTIGDGTADIVAIGDGVAHTVAANSVDIIAIGDGADKQCDTLTGCISIPNPSIVNDVIAIGDVAASFNQGSNVIAIGNGAMGSNAAGAGVGFFNSANFNIAIGTNTLIGNSTGTRNTALGEYAGADGFAGGITFGNSNHTGSNNTWLGYDSGPNTTTQLSNTVAVGYQAHNTQSNQTVIGNSSVTQNVVFGVAIPGIIYSAAGTPLPTCVSGLQGGQAVVSDATSPTYLGTYTSGGAITVEVLCNGSTWITH